MIVFGLTRERDDHRAAIRRRVREMLDLGLIDEVRALRDAGLTAEDQAFRTIGVPEVLGYLDGQASESEMIDAIVSQTWSLAKRQRAWFRRDRDVTWLDVTGRTAQDLAAEVVSEWRERVG